MEIEIILLTLEIISEAKVVYHGNKWNKDFQILFSRVLPELIRWSVKKMPTALLKIIYFQSFNSDKIVI